MSLLAMLADNFELEQPPPEEENENLLNDDTIAMDLNSAGSSADNDDAAGDNRDAVKKDANNITAFAAGAVSASDVTAIDTTFMTANDDENHNVIKHYKASERNNSEGTAETEQSFGSATTNAENNNDDDNYEEFHNNTVTSQSLSSSLLTSATTSSKSREMKLVLTFVLMVVVGTGMKIFQKLQAIPMYNYPTSLNLIQNFVYVPLCFMYIIPVSRLGLFNNSIPNEVTLMSKRPFVIMGLFDCITCMLLTFAAVYLPGSLLILLPQAAIPISMFFSKRLKGERYAKYQYFGALVVILGILVVLEPLISQRHSVNEFTCVALNDEFCAQCGEESTEEGCLSHHSVGTVELNWKWKNNLHAYVAEREHSDSNNNDSSSSTNNDQHDGAPLCQWVSSATSTESSSTSSAESTSTILIWSVVTILACIPMTLSSIYKEMALSGSSTHIDPIFLNGWVAWYQFLFSFPLSIPAGMAIGISPSQLPANIWDGIKCYLGVSTITGGCHPDDLCSQSPLYVNIFLVFNVAFNILLVFVLKFGSANVLFLAATIMVPIGNLAFALPFIPGSMPLRDSDIAGLMVILLGLVTYRFGSSFKCCKSIRKSNNGSGNDCEKDNMIEEESNLFSPGTVLPFSPDGVRRYARSLLNGGDNEREEFGWDTPYDDGEEREAESDFKGLRMPRSLIADLEEPLLTPVESVH